MKKEKPLDPDYEPNRAIRAKIHTNKSADKLAVILPGWHTHRFPAEITVRRLTKKGWSVLCYDFHDQILEPDEKIVVESFRYIRDTIVADLKSIKEEYDYKHINLIGISLGTGPLGLVADGFHGFDSATIVAGGDDFADDLWHGARTQHLREAFRKMHVSLASLRKEWIGISPVNHTKNFRGKPVKFYNSLTDEIIPPKYQGHLITKLKFNGADIKVKKLIAGHMVTCFGFYYFGKPD